MQIPARGVFYRTGPASKAMEIGREVRIEVLECRSDQRINDINAGPSMLLGPVLDSTRVASILKNLHSLHIRLRQHGATHCTWRVGSTHSVTRCTTGAGQSSTARAARPADEPGLWLGEE
ncbi:MAG: hypothetical protein V5B44_23310 [Candidatus Accumulibacter necessarius]|uniref:hypothetical protein n=1 Tax=Candidatus Accumulibacter necessarius TaxID=2954386 RepID=UPI002FC34E14